MTDYYTENLADFGIREIALLKELLDAWINKGLPEDFYNSGIKPAFNRNSGHVFLVNEDHQVAMLNGTELELFHSLPYSGAEGFLSDLIEENKPDDLHPDDVEYILDQTDMISYDLPGAWGDIKIDRILEEGSQS